MKAGGTPKIICVWWIILTLLAACTSPELVCEDMLGCVEVRPSEPVRIAVLLADSGEAAFLGEDSKGGVELAIDDRENGALDHQIELINADTGCDMLQGVTAVKSLTADPAIVGIIGPNCSNVAEAVMPIIDSAGLVLLSPSNTSPGLTASSQSWQGAYVRTAHNNLWQAHLAALFAFQELGGRTAVTLHDGSEYAGGLAQAFAATWRSLGGTIRFTSELTPGQTDLSSLLARLSRNKPDVLYLPVFEPEGNNVANALYGSPDLEDITLIGAGNLLSPDFPQSAGEAVQGMYLTGTAVSGADYDIFLAKWDVKFGGAPPASYHAHAYDAANILLNAIETVAQKGSDGALLIGRQALRQAIINTADFDGLTGVLTCDEAGDCASGTALGIYQITKAEITGSYWPPPLLWQPK